MKKRYKLFKIFLKLTVCVFLIGLGYVLNDILWDREHRFPKMPKLPTAFKECHFENVDAPWNLRNEQIETFYQAWQNQQTYGIYEATVGIDSLVRSYWLTEEGTVRLIRVIEAPFWKKKVYPVFEVKEIRIGYCRGDDFVEVDPAVNRQHDLIIMADGKISQSTIREF